jgi:small ligand-binding sensory domain FIST
MRRPFPRMARFVQSHATGADWEDVCRRAVARLGPLPQRGELGFVYFTDPLHPNAEDLLAYLRRHTAVRHWVGSVAEGIIGTGTEIYDQPAVSLLITDLDARRFRLVPGLARGTAGFLQQHRDSCLFSVLHGDPRNQSMPKYIAQMSQGLEGGFLVGGLSSGPSRSFLQIADEVTSEGLSGVLFAGSVPVVTGLSQGCTLIGPRREISEVENNIVFRLDDRPALDVLLEDIGEEAGRNLQSVADGIFVALPVLGSDTGDYLVRNLLGVDPDGKMLAVGDQLREGQQLQFARRDETAARDDLRRMLGSVKTRLTGAAKGALYFSCLGRGRHLFGDDSEELQMIRDTFGDLPVAGFFANGEISYNRLYGYTGVLAVFQETH